MPRIGSMPCPVPGCGCPDAVVKETAAGAVGIDCHRCGFGGFGKAGTKAKRLLAAVTTLDPSDEGTPPAPTGGTPPAPPPPAPAKRPTTLLG